MSRSALKTVFVLFLLLLCAWGVRRSHIIYRNSGVDDMRNRVVGARLVKDSIVPYYYHWFPGDPLRYVMELDVDTVRYRKATSITSSPVFHHALAPVCDYDQSAIEDFFYYLFYGLFLLVFGIAAYKSRNLPLALLFFAAFLFSDGWNFHVAMGQVYFLFGFLLFVIGCLLLRRQYLFAGLVLAFLCLLRLNCVLFLLPFALCLRQYRSFFAGFLAGMAVYGLFFLVSPFERQNWKEYFESVDVYSKKHLAVLTPGYNLGTEGPFAEQTDALLPPVMEGKHFAALRAAKARTPETNIFNEQSNFFLLYRAVFRKPPMLAVLNGLLLLGIALVAGLLAFQKSRKKVNPGLPQLLFSGLLLYHLSCFLSPVNTFPYQAVQWTTAAVFMVLFYKRVPKVWGALFLLGLLESAVFVPVFKGKHVLGELLLLTATLGIIFYGKWDSAGTSESGRFEAPKIC